MKLLFKHFAVTGRTGAASASIPGETPNNALDRAAYFSIDAAFYILPIESSTGQTPQIAEIIPGTEEVVHINFITEQEVSGSDRSIKSAWPTSEVYQKAFANMLANMLAHRETDLMD